MLIWYFRNMVDFAGYLWLASKQDSFWASPPVLTEHEEPWWIVRVAQNMKLIKRKPKFPVVANKNEQIFDVKRASSDLAAEVNKVLKESMFNILEKWQAPPRQGKSGPWLVSSPKSLSKSSKKNRAEEHQRQLAVAEEAKKEAERLMAAEPEDLPILDRTANIQLKKLVTVLNVDQGTLQYDVLNKTLGELLTGLSGGASKAVLDKSVCEKIALVHEWSTENKVEPVLLETLLVHGVSAASTQCVRELVHDFARSQFHRLLSVPAQHHVAWPSKLASSLTDLSIWTADKYDDGMLSKVANEIDEASHEGGVWGSALLSLTFCPRDARNDESQWDKRQSTFTSMGQIQSNPMVQEHNGATSFNHMEQVKEEAQTESAIRWEDTSKTGSKQAVVGADEAVPTADQSAESKEEEESGAGKPVKRADSKSFRVKSGVAAESTEVPSEANELAEKKQMVYDI
jgi:hypothetical protein